MSGVLGIGDPLTSAPLTSAANEVRVGSSRRRCTEAKFGASGRTVDADIVEPADSYFHAGKSG